MKNILKCSFGLVGLITLSPFAGSVAKATDLYDFSSTIGANNPGSQLGRLSRNGNQQTWLTNEAYPGVINATTTYNFLTLTIPASALGNAQYLQIDFDEPNNGANIFASAYLNSYDPNNKQTNYLGDAGASRDFAFGAIPPTPQDPRFFNVIVPAGNSLVLVLNTSAAAGLSENFAVEVEGFTDKAYTDAIPEPSTWALASLGLLGLGTMVVRRRGQASV